MRQVVNSKKPKLALLLAFIIILTTGCGSTSSIVPSQSATPTATATYCPSPSLEPTITVTPSPSLKPIVTVTPSPSIPPKQSAVAAIQNVATPEPVQVSLELISLTSPISHGSNATIVIKGEPNTEYNITVEYKSGPSTAEGLGGKTSDSTGRVSWTWKVGTRTTPGSWPITISGGGQSATFDFDVT